jgi:hypothetical protein
LGEVEGGTTEESSVTIAQLLTGFWDDSANRSIGGKTPSGALPGFIQHGVC